MCCLTQAWGLGQNFVHVPVPLALQSTTWPANGAHASNAASRKGPAPGGSWHPRAAAAQKAGSGRSFSRKPRREGSERKPPRMLSSARIHMQTAVACDSLTKASILPSKKLLS